LEVVSRNHDTGRAASCVAVARVDIDANERQFGYQTAKVHKILAALDVELVFCSDERGDQSGGRRHRGQTFSHFGRYTDVRTIMHDAVAPVGRARPSGASS
jgi:hypothetical protein